MRLDSKTRADASKAVRATARFSHVLTTNNRKAARGVVKNVGYPFKAVVCQKYDRLRALFMPGYK